MPHPFRLPGAALLAALFALTATACDKSKPPPSDEGVVPPSDDGAAPPPADERKAAVPADHPLHARYEGEGFDNACSADADCHAGGCSSEVCSAATDVMTTCDVPPAPLPANTSCGCVQGQCIWWNAEGLTLPAPEQPSDPPGGASCEFMRCAAPYRCLEYYGIAGPRGPKFASCEIQCGGPKNTACPEGQQCVTIADGPGQVCRPSDLTQ
ncbi:hypothetical protein [Paraliomyxa miuraensis]|uniref:hypothetical protein n=1 Tax=Paraliomyxa miuraensis TaxID=376150 RepID=UPI00225482EA|nr:hypothetical protein [Paraliomyxa miuraensis]MCX4246077.1 hypothetical protein [Paraliomyxa miuraensis]